MDHGHNIKAKTSMLLEEDIREYFHSLWVGKSFLERALKAVATKEKILIN